MSSIEAMWTVRFRGPGGAVGDLNGGVAIIESGRLMGGDSGYAYIGPIKVSGESVTGTLKIIRHDPNIESIFGDVDEFEIGFNGRRVSDTRIEGELLFQGHAAAGFFMNRLAELP